jgi:hypothetical protein
VHQDKATKEIRRKFREHVNDVEDRIATMLPKGVNLPTRVDILLWLTLIFSGAYFGKVKAVTRRFNKNC